MIPGRARKGFEADHRIPGEVLKPLPVRPTIVWPPGEREVTAHGL